MAVIVQKFGGSSLADATMLKAVAAKVVETRKKGYDVVVVVSAMGSTTDGLLKLAKEVCCEPHGRELDMLLSTGERISMALLSMAIWEMGFPAISFTGSQCGILTNDSHTNARIIEVRPVRIQDELDRGKIVIVAGFQGMSYKREITTLGRGGSDTTAVALAAALNAEACEIYSDVDGVYSADPRIVPDAVRLDMLTYQEMQELAEAGAKVLNAQAVEFAKRKGIAIYAKSTYVQGPGTLVTQGPDDDGCRVVGVTSQKGLLHIQVGCDDPSTIPRLLAVLDEYGAPGRQLMFAGPQSPGTGLATLVVATDNLHAPDSFRSDLTKACPHNMTIQDSLSGLSLIGAGINNDGANLIRLIGLLTQQRARVWSLNTSSFRISALVSEVDLAEAVRACHGAFIGGIASPL